jgi:hypothetical protein
VGKFKIWGTGMYQPAGLIEFAVMSAANKLTTARKTPHAAMVRTCHHNPRLSFRSELVMSV